MRKNNSRNWEPAVPCPKRFSHILFILSSIVTLASAQQKQITLNLKDVPLETIFSRITRHMGYSFSYNSQVIKPMRADVSVTNAEIGQVMDQCLKGKGLTYELDGHSILIRTISSTKQTTIPKDSLVHVSGRVGNTEGIALSGVSIQSLNSSRSAITDPNGAFDLNVKPGELLVFSYVGYSPLQVAMREAGNMSVTLQKVTSKLDEVQVVGYGTTTKRYNTGSVSSVKAEDIERQPVSNPIAALQGRVPGLVITQTSGLPGAGFTVQIRGQNSIRPGVNQPLFIVDGIPFDADNPNQLTWTSINVVNPLNNINPTDIESIDVLKDADATSIYGSRGANGVILITTKRPKAGKMAIDLGAYSGWGRPTRRTKLLSPPQYRDYRREALSNDGATPDMGNAFDLLGMDTTIQNNWYKELVGKTAMSSNIQLGISGGTAQTRFSAGMNYYRESTVFPGNFDATRKGLSFSLEHFSADQKFNLILKSSYSYNKSSLLQQDLTPMVNNIPYGFVLKDDKGNLAWNDVTINMGNPLAITFAPYTGVTDMMNTSLGIRYKPVKGLSLILNGGYNLQDFNDIALTPLASQPPMDWARGNSAFGHRNSRTWNLEPQVEYQHSVSSQGKITLMVGASWQQIERSSGVVSGSGYRSDALIGSISAAELVTSTDDYSLYRYSSGFSRLSLDWANTYLLNISFRRDASSRFGPGRQFANFGSIGAGWIFSNLDFIKDEIPELSFGKLRASYGTSGNDQIGDYSYMSTYEPQTTYPYQQSLSLFPSRLYNPDFGWEQFRKLEAALELGFIKDRLYASVGWYRNRSVNQLINYSLPTQTGFYNVIRNFPGVVQNKGWEFELRSENIVSRKWRWTSAFNLSLPKNALIAFPDLKSSSYATNYRIGEPLSVYLGYAFQGVDPMTGIYQFVDQNHDGKYNSEDYIICGNTDPKFYGGLQNTIAFKNLTLDFLFQFTRQKGKQVVYSNSQALGTMDNVPAMTLDHWENPGDNVPYAKLTQQPGTDLYNAYSLVTRSSAALRDASFVRLKNISLTYKLPASWLGRNLIRAGSIYVEAQNLLTITRFAGSDPESQSYMKLPPLRMIAAGFKLGL